MHKLKICLFGYSLTSSSGGAVTYTRNLARRLLRYGYDVTIVSIQPERCSIIGGVYYRSIVSNSKNPFSFLTQLAFCVKSISFYIKHKEYDLVHTVSSRYSVLILIWLIQKISKVQIICTILNPVKGRYLLGQFSKVICPTKSIYESSGKNAEYIPLMIELGALSNAVAYDFRSQHKLIVGTLGAPQFSKRFSFSFTGDALCEENVFGYFTGYGD